MNKHDEFPTKPNYQAIAESLEKENEILRSMNETQKKMVEIQTQRLNGLTQGVKDAIDIIGDHYSSCMSTGENSSGEQDFAQGLGRAVDILTSKTGISS